MSGQSLQQFMQGMVRDQLGSEQKAPPPLPSVLKTLRQHRTWLRERGISQLWVFGSVARGDERLDSDIDLIADVEPDARISLTAFARLQLDLSELLGARVDLAEWRTLRPHAIRSAQRDAVAVF
jgi:predicted nucleotidyltransferase